ncbi:MAG: hypothetical protein RML12_11425 [Xanthomonadales bacterium]|nr:hypothetical protein [Xanthomonadales bacterium]
MTSPSGGSGWILLRHDPRRLRLRRLTLAALWLASLYAGRRAGAAGLAGGGRRRSPRS